MDEKRIKNRRKIHKNALKNVKKQKLKFTTNRKSRYGTLKIKSAKTAFNKKHIEMSFPQINMFFLIESFHRDHKHGSIIAVARTEPGTKQVRPPDDYYHKLASD